MRYELYEPFHIGSKFQSHVRNRDILRALYYYYNEEIDEDLELNEDIINKNVIMSPFLNILTKKKKEDLKKQENLKIQLNLSINALNVIGDIPENVSNLFQEMLKRLPELGFELESTFSFYEIIMKYVIILEEYAKKPKDIFNRFLVEKFLNLKNVPNLNISHIRFSEELVAKEDDLFNLEILPNQTSPNTRMYLNILKRSKDSKAIIKFQDNYEESIKEICKRLVE